jgi:4-azaleucine resistance transporter AzlC
MLTPVLCLQVVTSHVQSEDAMQAGHRIDIRRGLVALFPLWPGVVSIGLAYAVVSREAGMSWLEIQLLSVFVYSGSGQFAITSLVEDKASALAIIATVGLLNIRHVLYGISARRWLPVDGQPPRMLLAHTLVDESYGVAEAEVNRGRPSGWFLLGAGLSLFTAWNISTAAGLVLSGFVDVPDDLGLEFIFPLSFVALTIPLIRHRRHLLAALVAVGVTIVTSQVSGSGLTVLAATLSAMMVAAIWEPADGS